MNREELLADIKKRFAKEIVDLYDKSSHRVYLEIRRESLKEVAAYIFQDLKARFNTASGLDTPTHLEILYHFSLEYLNLLISLRVKLPKDDPRIDSLGSLFKGSNWIEREIHEMLGIDFLGNPDLRRLLLPDEWPEGVYPLKRDYVEWDKTAIRDRGV